MSTETLALRPRRSKPQQPEKTLPRYGHYIHGFENRTGAPMSLRGVLPLIDVARGLVKEVCDWKSGNDSQLEVMGPHAKTVVMSRFLSMMSVRHALYETRTMSGIAFSTLDYPDGNGSINIHLFASGQNTIIPDGIVLDRAVTKDAYQSAGEKIVEIDKAVTRKGHATFGYQLASLIGRANFEAAFGNDSGVDPTHPSVMQLYSVDYGHGALVVPVQARTSGSRSALA